jgi:hypothetical protein
MKPSIGRIVLYHGSPYETINGGRVFPAIVTFVHAHPDGHVDEDANLNLTIFPDDCGPRTKRAVPHRNLVKDHPLGLDLAHWDWPPHVEG